jgi:hypothetical protein
MVLPTDKAITPWNGAGGTVIQDSSVRVGDSGNLRATSLTALSTEAQENCLGGTLSLVTNDGSHMLAAKQLHGRQIGVITRLAGDRRPSGNDPSLEEF